MKYIAKELRRLAVPIESIFPDPNNARLHGETNIAATRASLIARGQTLPLTVRLANRVVMTGNQTLSIARELGWTHIAVLFFDYTEEQAAAWAIAHNRTAELATWNTAQLAETIAQSPETNWIDVGFDAGELERIMASVTTIAEPTESPPENSPDTQWVGMPEFVQEDKTAFRSIVVHFKDDAAVAAFFAKIERPYTEKTRFVWYPEIEIERYADKVYTADGEG